MAKAVYSSDDGLDFNFDDFQPKSIADMSKREIITEAASGFYEGFKSETLDQRKWRKALEDHMPSGFKDSFAAIEETRESISDLYDHAEKKIKPLIGQLAFSIDSLVPEKLETIKKLTSGLKDSFYSAPNFQGKDSFETTMNAGVQKLLAETFAQEREYQEEKDAIESKKELAENAVREAIETKRRDEEYKLFSRMDHNINRLTTFRMTTGMAAEKKSLELQMRQYMLLGKMHQHQLVQDNIVREQLKAIIHHTGLSDAAKLTKTDQFKNMMKSRIIGGFQDRMFGESSVLTNGLKNIKRKGQEKVDELAEGLSQLLSLTGMADMMFGENSMQSTPATIGDFAGSVVGGKLRSKFAKPIADKLRSIEGVEKYLAQINRYAVNPNYGIEDFKKSDIWKKVQGTRAEETFLSVFEFLKENMQMSGFDTSLQSGLGIGGALQPGVFTKRLQMVQTEVVPGYLSLILKSIESIRLNKEAPLLKFNPATGKFINEAQYTKAVGETVKNAMKHSSIGYQAKHTATLVGEKVGVAEKDTEIIARMLLEMTGSTEPISPESIQNTVTYKTANKTQKAILAKVASNVGNGSQSAHEYEVLLEKALVSLRDVMPTQKALLQNITDSGGGFALEKLGYATFHEDGTANASKTAAFDLALEAIKGQYSDTANDEFSIRLKKKIEENQKNAELNKTMSLGRSVTGSKKIKTLDQMKTEVEKELREEQNTGKISADAKKKRVKKTTISPDTPAELQPKDADSDKDIKNKFSSFNAQFALDGVKRSPVTSWKYQSDPSEDPKKVGPMAQDLYKNFGDYVAPGGKEVNLVSMNGINMAAIQGLAQKQDEMEAKFKNQYGLNPSQNKQEFLLFAINENVRRVNQTLKDKTFAFSFPGIDTKELEAMGKNAIGALKGTGSELYQAAKTKANPMIATGNYYIDTIQSLVIDGLNDIYGKGKESKDFIKNKAQDYWENNKEDLKEKKENFFGKAVEFYGKALDFGKDMVFNVVPDFAKNAWNTLKEGKERLKALVSGPQDIYIRGNESPVVRAERMRAGYYIDAETGQTLHSVDSLLKIKGDVYDTGYEEIVLTRSDMVNGIYDAQGNKLFSIKDRALGAVVAGGKFLLDKASRGISLLREKGSELMDKAVQWWKDPSQVGDMLRSTWTGLKDKLFSTKGFSFYDKRQIMVLAQIRDLMAIGKKKKLLEHVYHRNLEDQNHLKGSSFLGVLGIKSNEEEGPSDKISSSQNDTAPSGNSEGPNIPQGNSTSSENTAKAFSKENIENSIEKAKEIKDKFLNSETGKNASNRFLNSKLGNKIVKGLDNAKLVKAAANSEHKFTFDVDLKGLATTLPDGRKVLLNSEEGRALVGYTDEIPKGQEIVGPVPQSRNRSWGERLNGWNNWLKDRSKGTFYEQALNGQNPYGPEDERFDFNKGISNFFKGKDDPNLPRKGETVVLEQNGTTIYQDENGIYRTVKTPQSRKRLTERFGDWAKNFDQKYIEKRRANALAGAIDGTYSDHELDSFSIPDVGPMEASSRALLRARDRVSGIGEKALELGERAANSKAAQYAKTKTQQGVQATAGFVKESGQQAVELVGRLSKNPAFQSLMKGLVGFKETYTGEAKIGSDVKQPGFTDSMLSKLGLQNLITKGIQSQNDRDSSRWGRFKTDMAERAQGAKESVSNGWENLKGGLGRRMGGKGRAIWEGVKTVGSAVGSGISTAAGFLKGLMGETVNAEGQNDFGTASGEANLNTSNIRGLGDGIKGVNDSDGDGDRDGGSTEMMRKNQQKENARKQEEAAKAKDAAKRAADSSLKYRSSENAIDRMMKGASGLIDFLKEKAGGFFSTALGLMEMIPGVGKLVRLGKAGLQGIGKGVRAAGRFGLNKLSGAANLAKTAWRAGGSRAVASMALNKTHAALHVARTAMMASGGTLGAMGGLGATLAQGALAVIASPLALKAAAVGAVGYGIYKTYKYFTRNSADEFQKLRLVQYGLKEDHDQQHRIMALEEYFLDGRVTPHNGANFIQAKLKEEEILEIMDIEPKDEERKKTFYLWLNDRFKPFFLKHVDALFQVDPKLKLKDVSKLEFEGLGKYLDKAQYLEGPYTVEESPFGVDEKMANTSADVPKMVEKLRHSKKKKKEKKESNVAAVSEDAKLTSSLNAHKAALAEEAKRQAAEAAKAAEAKNVGDSSKAKQTSSTNNLSSSEVGDDASKPTNPTGKPNGASEGLANVNIGALPVAGGTLNLGADGKKFLHVKQGVNIDQLNPNVLRLLSAMAAEYGELTGKMIPINDGFRSYAEQADLYRRMPGKAAKPGYSMHEKGLAFDIDTKVANELEKLGLMRKYGFTRPVGGEGWHVEPAGIQVDVNRSKTDPVWANSQIMASPGRGGGGYGAQSGSTMKRRNPKYAQDLWIASSSSTVENKPVQQDNPAYQQNPLAASTTKKQGTVIAGKGSDLNLSKTHEAVNQMSQASTQNEGEPAPTSTGTSTENKGGYTPKPGSVVEQTKEAAAAAARKANVKPADLQLFAAAESSMGQKTNSGVSSAQGPFQFMPKTWNSMVSQYGKNYGVTHKDTPHDPFASGLMAAAYMKENEPKIKRHKSSADIRDFYMAHMLGGSGVQTYLKLRPNDIPAIVMPGAAKNNPSNFYRDYKNLRDPYTRAEVDQFMAKKFSKLGQDFGVPVDFSSSGLSTGKEKEITAPVPTIPKQSNSAISSQATSEVQTKELAKPETPTSMFTSNQVDKRMPKETLRGNADQASGVLEAVDRSATASEALLKEVRDSVVPILRGMSETLKAMYESKGSTSPTPENKTPAQRPMQTTSAVSSSSLNRERKYG